MALVALLFVGAAVPANAQVAAGYSEYYIPGSEDVMSVALRTLGNTAGTLNTHALISITAWSDDITVYYDHWEDGIDFDPENPAATADETFTLPATGTLLTLDNTPAGGIPIPRNGANTYYDGGDRMYVAGGAVTVTRVSWREGVGRAVQAVAWEIYPVKPQLTTYVLPFGANLAASFPDFLRTYVIVQATADGTTFTVDLDGNGTADRLDQNFDGDTADPGDSSTVTLQAGQSFFIGNVPVNPAPLPPLGARATISSNAVIQGSATLQVKYVIGDPGVNYETRGLSAFPRGYWTREYYAPVGGTTNGQFNDIFLYNPSATTALTVTWEALTESGSFTINPLATVSFRTVNGNRPDLPLSGIFLRGSDAFWGVSTIDSTGAANEWAYSLLPSTLLYQEHFLGNAPNGNAGTASGVYLTVVQDNTRVFVDFNNDGAADQTYTLNRLQNQYIYDTGDGDLSGARFWATGPFTMAYGQDPVLAPDQATSGDLGYVAIPGTDFISLVLTVDKSVSPQVVPTAAGAAATFTLTVNSHKYPVDAVTVVDTLPPGWAYVADSAKVMKPDRSEVGGVNPTIIGSGTPADPYVLAWSSLQLGTDGMPGMAENREILITFTAETTAALVDGMLSQNRVRATGTRTVGGQTQIFNATDFAYVASGGLQIEKVSTAPAPAYPGDQFGYTVTVTNPAGGAMQTGVSLYDAIPAGLSYVDASGSVTCERSLNVRDEFATVSYANNDGTANWSADWAENDIHATVAGPTAGFVLVTGNALQLRYQASNYADLFSSASFTRNDGTNTWAAGWTESGDDGTAGGGSITVDANNNNRVNFGTGAAGRAITRTAAVSGGSVTVSFVLSDEGIDAGEGVVAEYDLGLGGGFVEMQRIDNNTLIPDVASSFTIATAGATSITVRFRTFGTYTGNDDAGLDTVNIAVDDAVGSSVRRTADLAGAGSAVLTVSYTAANVEAGDTVLVEASSDGTNFSSLETFDGAVGSGARTYDLMSPIDHASANTTIRFRISSGFNQANETFAVDNVDIAYVRSETFASSAPPGFLSSGSGCQLRAGQSLTLTFGVTVDNPLASGITTATNTAAVTTATYPMQLTASVTDTLANPSVLSASVAGRVWLDDGDGAQEIGEPGIANVEITLKDRFGTPVGVTVTDANGRYIFTGVSPGAGYYVEATDGLPAGTTQISPAGRTDGRTGSFDLSAGEDSSGGDLGYAPGAGTAAFGDLAWVDANGDGVRDPGEIGLAGVSVTLWRDVATTDGPADDILDAECTDPVTSPDDCDTQVLSVAAGPDGSYLFTGIPATGAETYFLLAAGPAGFFATDASSHRFLATAPGAYLTADFGFQADGTDATTHAVSDRVWLDDGDGIYQDGEAGIGGVTVELLDASLNVLGTTTTLADGTFAFAGVAGGGADYTVRINDTTGALVDTYGTTSYASQRFRDEDNLVASIDRTLPGEASFGFTLARSIGDTVFSDSSGGSADNIQQAGEPGIAGLVVRLYRDSGTSAGFLDGADALVGTLATDANGRYLFSGLANGGYIVSLAGPAGYVSSWPDADPAAGIQRTAAVAGGGNDLTADFGFRAPVQRTVAGTLWADDNADGAIDAGETARLAGVTVDILEGTTVVATVTTDAAGGYAIAGLKDATTYTIRVTDIWGALTGYSATVPASAARSADTTGGDATGVDFGFRLPVPTRVFLAWFRAVSSPQGVIVEWETQMEVGVVGYRVARHEAGLEVPVNERIVPAFVESRSGGRYALLDGGASGSPLTYTLYEVRRTGEPLAYGPFTVMPLSAGSSLRTVTGGSRAAADPLAVPEGKRYARQRRRPARTRVAAAAEAPAVAPLAAVGQKLRISVTADGLYRLFAADIAALLGKTPNQIGKRIREGSLRLSNRNATVAYLPRDNGTSLVFRGTALDTNFTGENVYWLEIGAGRRMPSVAAIAAAPSARARNFPERLRIKERVWPDFLAATDPQADYWLWKYLVAGDDAYGYGSTTVPLKVPWPAGAGRTATVTVRLVGGNDTAAVLDHHAVIRLNGAQIGEASWDGLAAVDVVCPFDQGLLTGSDVLSIEALLEPDVPESFVYLESLDLAYRRRFVAVDNTLRFTGGGNAAVTVSGFTDRAILLFDLTNPQRPKRVTGATLAGAEGNFTISFRPASATTPYLAIAQSAITNPESVAGWRSAGLADPGNAAEYLVITGEPLLAGANALAARRAGEGLSTKVVTVAAIMDEFNAGIYDPAAIRAFLATALGTWGTPPRYVVLAGDGSYDYRNVLGTAVPIVPPAFVWTPYGLAASDGWYADVDGDHAPEAAVGRLPAGSNADLLRLVDKIAAFEAAPTGEWERAILFAADNRDAAGDYPADTAALVGALPAGLTTTVDQVGAISPAAARALFKNTVDAGAVHVNWFGHAGYDVLADERLLYLDAATREVTPELANGSMLPLFTLFTCAAGDFTDPYLVNLGEALLLQQGGGASAVFSSTGSPVHARSAILARGLFALRYGDGAGPRLGDVLLGAMEAYVADPEGGGDFTLDIYGLLGDPALPLR